MKRKLLVIGTLMLCVGATIVFTLLLNSSRRSQRLDDGSVLSIVAVRFGATNSFVIGTPLQRMFGRFLPSNGISIAGVKLKPPSKQSFADPHGEVLAVLFRLSGAKTKNLDQSYNRLQLRVIIPARTGHQYDGFLGAFHRLDEGDGDYAFSFITAFPRDERWLDLKVVAEHENRQDVERREVVARFKLKNPASRSSLVWKAEPAPIVRRFDNLEMTLAEITTSPRVYRTPRDPSEAGSIPVRVLEDGVVSTNWGLHNVRVRDSLGNFWYFGSPKLVSNDWQYHMVWSGLDPRRVWKLDAHLARDAVFSADDLSTVRLPIPLRSSFQTNLHGLPVEIGFVNTDMLRIEILTNRSDVRLSFVRATDKNGKKLDQGSGSWGQWGFARGLELPPRGEVIDATFAIHGNYPFECFVQAKAKEITPRPNPIPPSQLRDLMIPMNQKLGK